MKRYGPYRDIGFREVDYYNAKKVVIDQDLSQMDAASKAEIDQTITYLETNSYWPFKRGGLGLNQDNSSIHVPTNIYDKSRRILNGVNWTTNLTQQFIQNRKVDPTLTWQYFCSSDGFLRVYPGMQWPRDADKVDTFDCRIRKWYIQAATSPKNILILLDSSGSMKGLRFAIARSTVSKILETLSDEDYFNVLQFSDEPNYVDECFNDTLMPASVDNVKRIQSKIDALDAQNFANFEKALTKAFELFRKEQNEYSSHYLCNKAIMLITDGAPENFDHIFDKFNWPNKTIRVFTFLIGKEVPENRQTKWMACVNKGKFTHISTRADVQENVQKYIQVLSRPLAINKAGHKVWSPVYLDYVTEQGEILVNAGKPPDLGPHFEDSYTYQGLGLILTISMPVYDRRDTVGPKEEMPKRNLLGVVGTDVRINELMKLIPTFELGVNGYAFAITNHGNIVFHPDYRPFYPEGAYRAKQQLKVRPKYNSVELSEVELPVPSEDGTTKAHPLRHYFVRLRSGGHNMTTIPVLTHCDGMKRAAERQQEYHFQDIENAFRLVFVSPKNHGNFKPSVPNVSNFKTLLDMEKDMNIETMGLDNFFISNWIFCEGERKNTFVKLSTHLRKLVESGKIQNKCNRYHMERLAVDFNVTAQYVMAWLGEGKTGSYRNLYAECLTDKPLKGVPDAKTTNLSSRYHKRECFKYTHERYGIGKIWIGTASGLTRTFGAGPFVPHWEDKNIETIKSLYYKRAVDGMEKKYYYVYTGTIPSARKSAENLTITMSTTLTLGSQASGAPMAVAAFNMRYSAFNDHLARYTFKCREAECHLTCNDTQHVLCYIVDDNGYILANNNPDYNGTGSFLGSQNPRLMTQLIRDKIYKGLKLTDYQGICYIRAGNSQESSSSFIQNPLRILSRFFFWIFSEIAMLLSEWNILSHFTFGRVWGSLEARVEEECGDWIDDSEAKYIYCNFVVNSTTGKKVFVQKVLDFSSCIQSLMRYTLNKNALISQEKRRFLPDCAKQCSEEGRSYEARWLNKTNLVFIVWDATCDCSVFEDSSEEPEHEDSSSTNSKDGVSQTATTTTTPSDSGTTHDDATQCQILLNFANELKNVDSTRTPNNRTLCLDATNELLKDETTCGQSAAFKSDQYSLILVLLLLVLRTLRDPH
ncbi:hypothetical protein RRG08_051823 [Elysia crispata]|uniref:VWFA domain-containing protein n=1 Tax=Elysia crispata TaxID=231223 RepID=A0AAE0Z983_9GAST|nr:hypothetical protein RRG08_051823 [Elysia crispata]